MGFLSEAQAILPWITEHRRWLHRHPEHGAKEFLTAEYLCGVLQELGLEPRRLTGTAIVADLVGGKPGPIIALRADMDALPVTEATGLPFASEHPGMMHACGHDMHMAGALGAAKLLAAHKEELAGTVRFLFQPDEEQGSCAERMIEDGCLEGVSRVYGAHVRQELPLGSIGICPGPYYAANNPFVIRIIGKGSHGAEPHNGLDPIVAASQIVTAIQTLVTRRMAPVEPAVITIGTFHAGTQCNIVAGEAVLEGVIRSFGEENRAFLCRNLKELVETMAKSFGMEGRVEFGAGHPGVINDPQQAELVRRAAVQVLGEEQVVSEKAGMVSEDFGCFLQNVPGCFYHIGVGGPAPLHAAGFCPEEWPLANLAAVHAQVVLNAMTEVDAT